MELFRQKLCTGKSSSDMDRLCESFNVWNAISDCTHDENILQFYAYSEVFLSQMINYFDLKLFIRACLIIDNNQAQIENFIFHIGKIFNDKTKNQIGPESVETVSFLHLHPIDEVEFEPSEFSEALTNTCQIKPVVLTCQEKNKNSNADDEADQEETFKSFMSPSPVKKSRRNI